MDYFSEIYSNFSNYSYGTNNPISHVDVEGNYIDVPNNKYRAQTLNDLAKIYATPMGKQIIDALINSDKTFTIDAGAFHFFGNGYSVLTKEINYKHSTVETNGVNSPSYVVLAHELQHAFSHNRLGYNKHVSQTKRLGESRAVKFGNYIREIYSKGSRYSYSGLGRVFNENDRINTGGLRLNENNITISSDTKFSKGRWHPTHSHSRIDFFEVLYNRRVISNSDNSQKGKKKDCVHCKPAEDRPDRTLNE